MSQQTEEMQAQLNDFLETYETQRERQSSTDLGEFLPGPGHPLHKEARREMVRMDLEYGWLHGQPRSIADYLALFPDLFDDPTSAQEITYEEYRLRMVAGDNPSAADYERRYGVRTVDWPGSDARSENYSRTVVTSCPELNEDLLDTFTGRPDTPAADWDMHEEVFPPLANNDRRSLSGETAKALLRQDVLHSPAEVSFLLKEALTSLPDIGTWFLNFNLIAVLGEGGFGRVYLARQGGLANRLVALKITIYVQGEEQKLAQLQHTNVVPIYSAHKQGALHAVCMPYFGPTTLADVVRGNRNGSGLPTSGADVVHTLRQRGTEFAAKFEPGPPHLAGTAALQSTPSLGKLEKSDYVTAVLLLAERIAEGLIHAHEHGILHGDLKPANILLTDEGEPMLLDFNLATDLKVDAGLGELRVGGTLPYMAPEHLRALQGGDRQCVDARSDVYSLGVILFELLTGRLPFDVPRGPMLDILPGMIDKRLQAPPRLRSHNRAVTYAVESIVRTCLHPDPAKRYQTVRQLQDDLQRHRQNFPLQHAPEVSLVERMRKWVRRHPRLTAPNTLIILALSILAITLAPGVWSAWQQWQTDRANLRDAKTQADLTAIENEDARTKRRIAEEQAELERKKTEEAKERERLVQEQIDALNLYRRFHTSSVVARDLLDCVGLIHMRPETWSIEKARLDRLDADCRTVLKDYDVMHVPRWQEQPRVTALPEAEQKKACVDAAGLLFALAEAEELRGSRSVDGQRGRHLGSAADFNARARACFADESASCAFIFQQGKLAHLSGKKKEASQRFADAEKLLSDYETAAREHAKLNDSDKAKVKLRAKLNQRDDADYYWMALELAADGKVEKAGAMLKDATRKSPDHFGAWHLRALCDQAEGEKAPPAKKAEHFRDAQASWNVCAALKPDRSDVLYWRGVASVELGKTADARSDFEPLTTPLRYASHQDPYIFPALYQEALILAKDPENEQKAYFKLNKILALDKEHVDALLLRGLIKAKRDLRNDAVADAERALKHASDFTPARYYQAGTIYAVVVGTPQSTAADAKHAIEDAKRAIDLLTRAVRGGYGAERLETDANLRYLRDVPEFRKLVDEATKRAKSPSAKPG